MKVLWESRIVSGREPLPVGDEYLGNADKILDTEPEALR